MLLVWRFVQVVQQVNVRIKGQGACQSLLIALSCSVRLLFKRGVLQLLAVQTGSCVPTVIISGDIFPLRCFPFVEGSRKAVNWTLTIQHWLD